MAYSNQRLSWYVAFVVVKEVEQNAQINQELFTSMHFIHFTLLSHKRHSFANMRWIIFDKSNFWITYSFSVNNCNFGNISTFIYKFDATDVAPIIFNNINTIKCYRALVLLMVIKLNVDSRTMTILMVELGGSSKTTILCPLKRDIVATIPITGFNVERVEHKNISFTACDVGIIIKINKVLCL